ncbi:hypothetical protein EDB92DRAFT_1950889 [Lactarius akahatsu]|uniref:DUF6532 domain-containing protein n=1 Tax=Lactarius akahatsu TaxID=416441 RepID=A0AAD4L8D8_9AGAM|nr:hypothetical protein EDB92DRAFT_1950889 [Lactarius akahatsu]
MPSTPSQSQGRRPVTQAKNATQHPRQVVLDAQQKHRSNEVMAKVREQACLERRVAEQEIRAALKNVARIQDQQELKDIQADQPGVAPSLRRHKTLLFNDFVPCYKPIPATEADKESDKDLSEDEAAPVNRDSKREEMGPGEEDDGDIEDGEGEGAQRKTKKKGNSDGDPMRALIDSLRKKPCLVPGKSAADIGLVTKEPPIPAVKGKKPRARLVQSVAHPVDKSKSGICVDWATKVANANSSFTLTTTPATSHSSTRGLGAFAPGSSTTTQSGLPQGAYQKGLDDEVEILHYQASLPGPGSVTLKQGLLKRDLDTNTAFPIEQPAAKKPRTGRRSLPPGAEENNRFRAVFIPTYEWWVRTQANPWVIPDDVAIPVLQSIWDVVYDDVPWVIYANDCVFERVMQHLYEWRSSFRSIADVMIEQFFECKDYRESFKDYDTCQAWAEDMLADCKFIWEKVDQRSGLMCAPFILQVFATHLNSTAGAAEVPALRATGVNEGASIVAKYPPKGALALAAAAVERTLKLWADGEMEVLQAADPMKKQANKPSIKVASKLNPLTGIVSNVASNFSAENWAAKTNNYFKSINKMKLDSLEEVVQLAMPFMSPSKTHRQGCSYGPQSLVEDDEDIRACLVDD